MIRAFLFSILFAGLMALAGLHASARAQSATTQTEEDALEAGETAEESPAKKNEFFKLPEEEDESAYVLGPPKIDNLFFDLTTGVLNEPGDDATAFGSIGLNYGFPFIRKHGIGMQLGGDIALHEKSEYELDLTSGFFIRDVHLGEDVRAGAAALGQYRHTAEDGDLFSLRGIVGVSTRSGHHIGVRGTYPLQNETVLRGSGFKEVQEITTRHDAFWGYDVSSRLGTEASVGYQSDAVNAVVFGLSCSYSLERSIAVAPMGEINTMGDYAVGLSLVYDFGGAGRRSTLTHFGTRDADDFTPFRKRSLPLQLVHLEEGSRGPQMSVVPMPGQLPPPRQEPPRQEPPPEEPPPQEPPQEEPPPVIEPPPPPPPPPAPTTTTTTTPEDQPPPLQEPPPGGDLEQ